MMQQLERSYHCSANHADYKCESSADAFDDEDELELNQFIVNVEEVADLNLCSSNNSQSISLSSENVQKAKKRKSFHKKQEVDANSNSAACGSTLIAQAIMSRFFKPSKFARNTETKASIQFVSSEPANGAVANYEATVETVIQPTRRVNYKTSALFDGKYYKIVKQIDLAHISAICTICSKIVKGSWLTTGNFTRHYAVHHPTRQEELETYYRITSVPSSQQFTQHRKNYSSPSHQSLDEVWGLRYRKKMYQSEVDNLLTKFIINGLRPLSLVEDPFLTLLLWKLGYESLSRSSLSNIIIENMFPCVQKKVKAYFKNVPFISTTADIWSINKSSYLGVTAHWIEEKVATDKEFELKSTTLACHRLSNIPNNSIVKELLHEVHSEYIRNLEIISGTTTNNICNNIKSLVEYGIDRTNIVDYEETLFDIIVEDVADLKNNSMDDKTSKQSILALSFQSSSYQFNLIATTDIKNIVDKESSLKIRHINVLKKCNAFWKLALTKKYASIFDEHFQEEIPIPCSTKWISLFQSLEFLVNNQNNVMHILCSLEKEIESFNQHEWKYIEIYVKLMKPIACGLDILQQNVFYGFLLPTLTKVDKMMRKNISAAADEHHELYLAAALHSKFEQRFRNFLTLDFQHRQVECAVLATFSEPFFKTDQEWIPDSLDKTAKINTIKELAINALNRLKKMFPFCESKQKLEKSSGDFFKFISVNKNVYVNIHENGAINRDTVWEVCQYCMEESTDYEVLENYPVIKQLFLKYNCIPSNSAPVERLFPLNELIRAPKNEAIDDGIFETMLFLKGNIFFETF